MGTLIFFVTLLNIAVCGQQKALKLMLKLKFVYQKEKQHEHTNI